jgi:hypothetical protein
MKQPANLGSRRTIFGSKSTKMQRVIVVAAFCLGPLITQAADLSIEKGREDLLGKPCSPPSSLPSRTACTTNLRVSTLAAKGVICAPVDVRIELEEQKDDLFEWSKGLNGFFVEPDRELLETSKQIVNAYPGLIKPNSPKSGADPFVIALAEIHKVPVVTYETTGKMGGAPKIPNVCAELNIEVVTLVEVLRAEGFKF